MVTKWLWKVREREEPGVAIRYLFLSVDAVCGDLEHKSKNRSFMRCSKNGEM